MLLKDKVIVILGNTSFEGQIRSTSLFFARHLAKNNKVYYIDYPLTIKDCLRRLRLEPFRSSTRRLNIFSKGVSDTEYQNLKIVHTLPVLTINFLPEGYVYRTLLKINEYLIGIRLKRLLLSESNDNIIYINSFNFHYPNIAKILKPKLTIYHCVDPMIISYDIKHGIKSELQLVSDSNIVICTSRALYDEKRLINPNTYFIPNAVELESSSTMNDIHPKLKSIRKPIVGYLGTIERRIDYNLLRHVVDDHKDKSFVFAGPVDKRYVPDLFYQTNNVFFTGPVKYAEVSQMISSFDVAIIPFTKDDVSKTIFPIKLFEYLSLGKPIVMTDFNNDLKEFTDDQIEFCADAASFSKAIDESLIFDNSVKAERRQKLARENTWEVRTNQLSEIIEDHLQDKSKEDNIKPRSEVSNEKV